MTSTKWYYWANGQCIGEGHQQWGDNSVRYIYSGNQKIAMVRPINVQNRALGEKTYYFINNPQGTPVLIVDDTGTPASKINMDEWGNIGNKTKGSPAELNFTGKKYDPATDLFYFNQRYYDPEIGRFLTEDPARQGLNSYSYCGNNPLMFVDPDGEFAFLVPLIGAIIQGAVAGAYINTAVVLATGRDAGQAMRQGALAGAISGGIFNIIGGVSLQMEWGTSGLEKVALHGVGGGISSWAMGGDFWSGAKGGAAAELLGQNIMGSTKDYWSRIGLAGLVGGTAAWASGSDFNFGALAGGFGMAFNELGEGHEEESPMMKSLRIVLRNDRHTTPEAVARKIKNIFNKTVSIVNSDEGDYVAMTVLAYGPMIGMAFPATGPFVLGAIVASDYYLMYKSHLQPGAEYPKWK